MSTFDIEEALRLLAKVETATIGHFLSDGFLAPSIQCLTDEVSVVGPALTVKLPRDDGSALVRAISQAVRGQILVVDRDGDEQHACWGAVLTVAAQAMGIAGVVIDGFVTDIAAIRASGLPVWCRGRSPLTTKPRGGGAVGGAILCGGAAVHAGDIVLADENGVVILQPADARRIAEEALAIQENEPGIIARLRAGENIASVYGIGQET